MTPGTRFGPSALLMALLWSTAAQAAAQDLGARIRVTTTDGRRIVGTVTQLSEEVVELAQSPTHRSAIARDQVRSIEHSLRQERRFGRHFAITVGAAAGVGAVGWALAWSPCTETGFMACFMSPSNRGEAFRMGAVAGGLLGVPVGIIVGATLRSDVWSPISPTSAARVTLLPTMDGGASLQLRIPF